MDSDEDVTLFCGNVSPNVKEALLYELFTQAGPIASLNMPKRDNEHRGFAFIKFHHECAVQYAVDLFDGTKLDGRKLTIQNKSRKTRRPPDIYDVLGSALEVPFGPMQSQMNAPMLLLPVNNNISQQQQQQQQQPEFVSYPIQFQTYGAPHHGYAKHERNSDHYGTPYQRYHSTDRNRSERTNADRNRNHQSDHSNRPHSDRRHSDHQSDRYSGRHSNHSSHRRRH